MKYYNIFLAESKIREEKEILRNFLNISNNSINEQEISFSDDIIEIINKLSDQDEIAKILIDHIIDNKIELDFEIAEIEDIFMNKKKQGYFEVHFRKSNGGKAKKDMKISDVLGKVIWAIKLNPNSKQADDFIQSMYDEISGGSSLYKFKVVKGKDMVKYFSERNYEDKTGPLNIYKTISKESLKFYTEDLSPKQCSLLIRVHKKTDKINGRALLWKLDDGSIYLDDIFVTDTRYEKLFITYAKEKCKATYCYDIDADKRAMVDKTVTIKNWVVRDELPQLTTFSNGVFTEDNEFILLAHADVVNTIRGKKKIEWTAKLPDLFSRESTYKKEEYLDGTFKELRDGLTKKIVETEYKWLWDAAIENAVVGRDKDSRIVWYKGDWNGGIWEDGTWKNGEWGSGTWKSGTWEKGVWWAGKWYNGTWKSGTWEKGEWFNGTWKNGTWKDGVWRDGIWENGTWEDGYWFNGTWKKGTGNPSEA